MGVLERLSMFLVLAMLLTVWPTVVHADDIRLLGTWTYTSTESETETRETKEVKDSKFERFSESYRLDISKNIYPKLIVNGGTEVERNNYDLTSDEGDSDAKDQEVRPYIDFELNDPIYTLSGGYLEREFKQSGSAFTETQRTYLENIFTRAQYRPVDLPTLELNYDNSNSYNRPKTRDRKSETLQLSSRYNYREYQFIYNYLNNDDTNKLEGTSTETTTHSGRVRYGQNFYDGKVSINASLRGEYTDKVFSGRGLRDFPAFPAGVSFYFIDNDQDPNNNLPGDYLYTPFGSNLNLNGQEFLDIGLDFGEAVAVSMLELTLTGLLDPNATIDQIANWEVYVSNDQDNWEFRVVQSVEYVLDRNLLEVRFSPGANHEYVMIVYSPPLVTNQVGPVLVSDLRAFITRDLDDGTDQFNRTHNAKFNVGWQVSPRTAVNYNMNLQERKDDLFDEQAVRLSNNFNINHQLNRLLNSSADLSVTDTWEDSSHEKSNYSYGARLRADYLETLRQTLVYNGNYNDESRGESLNNAVFLETYAELYKGWDMTFDQGASWEKPAEGPDSSSLVVRVKNSLKPHESLTLLADYSWRWEKEEDEPYERRDRGRLRTFWSPLDTLSLSGTYRYQKSESGSDTSWEYSVSWLPLRDGDLQVTLGYFEKEDSSNNRTYSYSSNLTWEVTDYIDLKATYTHGQRESDSTINDYDTFYLKYSIYYN